MYTESYSRVGVVLRAESLFSAHLKFYRTIVWENQFFARKATATSLTFGIKWLKSRLVLALKYAFPYLIRNILLLINFSVIVSVCSVNWNEKVTHFYLFNQCNLTDLSLDTKFQISYELLSARKTTPTSLTFGIQRSKKNVCITYRMYFNARAGRDSLLR